MRQVLVPLRTQPSCGVASCVQSSWLCPSRAKNKLLLHHTGDKVTLTEDSGQVKTRQKSEFDTFFVIYSHNLGLNHRLCPAAVLGLTRMWLQEKVALLTISLQLYTPGPPSTAG